MHHGTRNKKLLPHLLANTDYNLSMKFFGCHADKPDQTSHEKSIVFSLEQQPTLDNCLNLRDLDTSFAEYAEVA